MEHLTLLSTVREALTFPPAQAARAEIYEWRGTVSYGHKLLLFQRFWDVWCAMES